MRSLPLVLLACVACPWAAAAQETPRIVAAPDTFLYDEPIHIRIVGLAPGDTATLRVNASDAVAQSWTSTATFVADGRGEVDLAKQAPIRGSYQGVEPMGPFWSLATSQPNATFVRAYDELPLWARRSLPRTDTTLPGLDAVPTRLEVESHGHVVASGMVLRRFLLPGTRVTRVREHGLYGTLFEPPGPGPHPTLLALTGSSGGIIAPWALLAAHGYTTLALGWLQLPGTSQQMTEVPLEYFDTALAWLRHRPGVDTARMGVIGWSLGGELTLLLASLHPELKAAVAMAGSPVVWEAVLRDTLTYEVLAQPTNRSSWTQHGTPLPFANRRWPGGLSTASTGAPRPLPAGENYRIYVATMSDSAAVARGMIPLERSRAAFLLLSARDDEAWTAAALSQLAMDRLRRAGYAHPYEQVVSDVGGHGLALPPYMTGALRNFAPERAAQIVHVREQSWARELRFLQEHLRRVR